MVLSSIDPALGMFSNHMRTFFTMPPHPHTAHFLQSDSHMMITRRPFLEDCPSMIPRGAIGVSKGFLFVFQPSDMNILSTALCILLVISDSLDNTSLVYSHTTWRSLHIELRLPVQIEVAGLAFFSGLHYFHHKSTLYSTRIISISSRFGPLHPADPLGFGHNTLNSGREHQKSTCYPASRRFILT